MPGAHDEDHFQALVVGELVERSGWVQRPASDVDKDTRLIAGDLFAFLDETQPDECAELAKRLGERWRGCTRRNPTAVPSDDLVNRAFSPDRPDALWVADVTEHPTGTGKVYLAVVIDTFSRMVVGHSIADHLRTELVVDALEMALWRRRPAPGTIHHGDHGSQYTSWAFGQRLRAAGLLGSMGSVGDALDNAVAEAFFATLQTELLDRRDWRDRRTLARAIFDYIETFYNPVRRHSTCGMLAPVEFDRTRRTVTAAAA